MTLKIHTYPWSRCQHASRIPENIS